MIKLLVLTAVVGLVFGAPNSNTNFREPAKDCDPALCKLPDCSCFSTDIPAGLKAEDIPQLVYFTFDDAVQILNHDNYYSKAFFGKKNPNGCQIGSTYFISHEYSDYSKVHNLHANGQEIALHSISHFPETDLWKNMTVKDLTSEFIGERELISHFANVPIDDIKGLRVPFLQLSGDNSFEMMKATGLQYDCSWPTQNYMSPALWPYTLDYKSNQDCSIPPCPTSSFPGVWVAPMVNWKTKDGNVCAMTDSCPLPDDEEGILEFIKDNFNRHYKGNKAPFGFYIHASWFTGNVKTWAAYQKFVDYLQTLKDVYIVTLSEGIEYARNPQTIANLDKVWPECRPTYEPDCVPSACRLDKNGEERYMTTCADCPNVYPWVNNPLGQ